MKRNTDHVNGRLDALLLAVGRIQGTNKQHSVLLRQLRTDMLLLDDRLRALTDSVDKNRTQVAVLNWKVVLVAATSGGMGSVLLRLLQGG